MKVENLPYSPVSGYLCDPDKSNGTGRCAMGYLLTFFWSPTRIKRAAGLLGSDSSYDVMEYLMGKDKKNFNPPKTFKKDASKIETKNDGGFLKKNEPWRAKDNTKPYVDAFYMLPKFLKTYEEFFRSIDSDKYDRAVGNINSIIKERSVITLKTKKTPKVEEVVEKSLV